jgi:hypothetical protein
MGNRVGQRPDAGVHEFTPLLSTGRRRPSTSRRCIGRHSDQHVASACPNAAPADVLGLPGTAQLGVPQAGRMCYFCCGRRGSESGGGSAWWRRGHLPARVRCPASGGDLGRLGHRHLGLLVCSSFYEGPAGADGMQLILRRAVVADDPVARVDAAHFTAGCCGGRPRSSGGCSSFYGGLLWRTTP